MTSPSDESATPTPEEQPKDATMLVLVSLIRALHEANVLPGQAVADMLDRRALNAAMRGRSGDEATVRKTAVLMQAIADQLESYHPFPKGPPTPQN